MAEVLEAHAGARAVQARLSEVLFETLRRYFSKLPPGTTGWLAGAHDAEIGAVLAAVHRDPSCRWTLESLAKTARISGSVLAERF